MALGGRLSGEPARRVARKRRAPPAEPAAVSAAPAHSRSGPAVPPLHPASLCSPPATPLICPVRAPLPQITSRPLRSHPGPFGLADCQKSDRWCRQYFFFVPLPPPPHTIPRWTKRPTARLCRTGSKGALYLSDWPFCGHSGVKLPRCIVTNWSKVEEGLSFES